MSQIVSLNSLETQEGTWSRRRKTMSNQQTATRDVEMSKRTRIKTSSEQRFQVDNCLRALQKRGADLHSLVAYGDALCNLSHIDEALDSYAMAFEYGEPSVHQLKTLVKSLVNLWSSELHRHLPKSNVYSCVKCCGVLADPVTILCGHSMCRTCYEASTQSACVKCGFRNLQKRVIPVVKPNVVIHGLTQKWWDKELAAVSVRSTGNELFKADRLQEALEEYSKAIELAPQDHRLYGNRSQTYLKLGRIEEALDDATTAISCKPDWSKGHYRKGLALLNLNHPEEALVCFLHCAALSGKDVCTSLYEELAKLLVRLLTPPERRRRRTSDGGSGSGLRRPSSSEGNDSMSDDSSYLADEPNKEGRSALRGPTLKPVFKPAPNPRARSLLERLKVELAKFPALTENRYERLPNLSNVNKDDFECTLCYRLLWQPVSTPCGHTFCRSCLQRCLDHNPQCPLCKTALAAYLEMRQTNVTEFLDASIAAVLPSEYKERHEVHVEEMRELASNTEIPIFVCTLSFPTIPCPLHVFEPRYRLMIRRAMETGTREFGMCGYVENAENGYADVGTVMEIRDVQFFPDGRSVVDTIGARRYRVLRKGVRDGYNTGKVEYLQDTPIAPDMVGEVTQVHDALRLSAEQWIASMTPVMRERISQHSGTMPDLEADWITLPQGPSWHWWLLAILPVGQKHQITILGMTELKERLEAMHKILTLIRRRQR